MCTGERERYGAQEGEEGREREGERYGAQERGEGERGRGGEGGEGEVARTVESANQRLPYSAVLPSTGVATAFIALMSDIWEEKDTKIQIPRPRDVGDLRHVL